MLNATILFILLSFRYDDTRISYILSNDWKGLLRPFELLTRVFQVPYVPMKVKRTGNRGEITGALLRLLKIILLYIILPPLSQATFFHSLKNVKSSYKPMRR